MSVQKRNGEMVSLLSADFIRKKDPAYLLNSVYSSYLALPSLRGFWPMNVYDDNNVYDMSGSGRTLTRNNGVLKGTNDYLSYFSFDGVNDYLERTYVADTQLTMLGSFTTMAWIYADSANAGNAQCISGVVGGGGVLLNQELIIAPSNNYLRLRVADTVPSAFIVDTTEAITFDTWNFVVGRYTDQTLLEVGANNIFVTTSTVPATALQDISTNFRVGYRGNNAAPFDGNVALVALCAGVVSDALLNNIYQKSRVLFGV